MMALTPIDEIHALQIQAGTLGRKTGHEFEDTITEKINAFNFPFATEPTGAGHVFTGNPASLLLNYIGTRRGAKEIVEASALSTGALATSEAGKRWLTVNGASVSRCKSDIVITMKYDNGISESVGVSTKQCNNDTPTNAQLYFTTARGFTNLLKQNGIPVSERATTALRQFCGDAGFRPTDYGDISARKSDPRRFFWEEIDTIGRNELEDIFRNLQDQVSTLLLQKAYLDDPFIPDFLIHKTTKAKDWNTTEVALYSIPELVALSRQYQGFATRAYSVRKGSFRDPDGVSHLAPRFGVIQMQRGGQKQHPEQIQFNLEAGYFYKL